MFNKKSFLLSFAGTAIYFAIQDYRREARVSTQKARVATQCQKRLNQYKQVQKEIKDFK